MRGENTMSDVNQESVVLTNGRLNADLRVNYEFGLVLGVNEFRQEQEYFLEKDYLYNRELHGYGTASGLKVIANRQEPDDLEVQITIEPGMGLDQWGRPIVVREPQCAHLGAWLAKWEKDHPGTIAEKLDEAGYAHLYVVASHSEYPDVCIPITGCRCGETVQAASRIRDSYNIEFRWEPPQMPAWDAVRSFAKLMSLVRIVPGLPLALSDEQEIIEQVRKLDQPYAADAFASMTQVLRLPAEIAREALDRIFTIWITEVRPNPKMLNLLASNANGRASEAAILLARIDFQPELPYENSVPRIISFQSPCDDGRPFLLHTELMQELLLLSKDRKPEREFATLQVADSYTLYAWVHHPQPLVLPEGNDTDSESRINALNQQFKLSSEDNALIISDATWLPDRHMIQIQTVDPMQPGSRIELTFMLDAISVEDEQPLSLLASIDLLDFDYVGHDHGTNTITTYTIAGFLPTIREFVSFSTIVPTSEGQTPELFLWFHTDEPVKLPPIITGQRGALKTSPSITFSTSQDGFSFVCRLRLTDEVKALTDKDLLSFAFDTNEIYVGNEEKTLSDVIQEQSVLFVGYDGDHTITAHYQVNIPPELSLQELLTLPSQRFVVITPDPNRLSEFEIWFHPNVTKDSSERFIQPDSLMQTDRQALLVYAEPREHHEAMIQIPHTITSHPQRNVFTVQLDTRAWNEARSGYLRFVFMLDRLQVMVSPQRAMSLREFIRWRHIIFEGYNGKDAIIAYLRVQLVVRQEGEG
jgi:hypothetical protein